MSKKAVQIKIYNKEYKKLTILNYWCREIKGWITGQ